MHFGGFIGQKSQWKFEWPTKWTIGGRIGHIECAKEYSEWAKGIEKGAAKSWGIGRHWDWDGLKMELGERRGTIDEDDEGDDIDEEKQRWGKSTGGAGNEWKGEGKGPAEEMSP